MSDYQTKNYTAHGGREWRPSEASAGVSAACGANGTPGALGAHGANTVIGGKLTFLPGATVEGLNEALSMPKAPFQPDSSATTIAGLREDFNALLGNLRVAGLMANEAAVE